MKGGRERINEGRVAEEGRRGIKVGWEKNEGRVREGRREGGRGTKGRVGEGKGGRERDKARGYL